METYFEIEQYSAKLIREDVWHIHDATIKNYPGLHEDGSYNNPSSMYVIVGSTTCLLIDLGNPYNDNNLRKVVEKIAEGKKIIVAITHNHFDHIGALNQFNDCEMYVPYDDFIEGVHHPIVVKENDHIIFDDYDFLVINSKGHTEGSKSFYDKNKGLIATGDAYGSSYVWLLFIDNVIKEYQQTVIHTLEILKDHPKDLLFLCGHRYQQQIEPVKGINPLSPSCPHMTTKYLEDMLELTKQILNGTAASHEFEVFNRKDLKAYTYGNAEIDTYLLGHEKITLG